MSMKVGDKGLNSDINVTPLVDVMLVLLIIFMVITPMLSRGKAVLLPTVANPEKQTDNGKDIIVSVEYMSAPGKSKYNVYLGQFLVAENQLQGRLEDELRREPGREVFIKGDSRLEYGSIRKVMEVCNQAGFSQVRLATEEAKKKWQ